MVFKWCAQYSPSLWNKHLIFWWVFFFSEDIYILRERTCTISAVLLPISLSITYCEHFTMLMIFFLQKLLNPILQIIYSLLLVYISLFYVVNITKTNIFVGKLCLTAGLFLWGQFPEVELWGQRAWAVLKLWILAIN